MKVPAQETVPLKETWFVNWAHWQDINHAYTEKKKSAESSKDVAKKTWLLQAQVTKNFTLMIWYWLKGDNEINGYMTSLWLYIYF